MIIKTYPIKSLKKVRNKNMKQTITENHFIDDFRKIRPSNFSYEGLKALYEYLTELEGDGGQQLEFDPIAYCCEFTEYEDIKDFQRQHGHPDDHPTKQYTIEEIRYFTQVIEVPNSKRIIVQNF